MQRIEQSQCIRLTYAQSVSGCLVYGTETATKEGVSIIADAQHWCQKTIETAPLWIVRFPTTCQK